MKILLASSSSGSHGDGELWLLHLGRALVQRGHKVMLWASEHPRMDELANSFSGVGEVLRSPYQNTYDHRGRSISSYLNLPAVRQLAAEWQRAKPDFLHLNKQNLEDGLDLLQAARRSEIPNLCTVHITRTAQHLKARLAPARDFIARRGLRNYPGVLVTVDEKQRQSLADVLGDAKRIRLVPNGVPLLDLSRREAARALKRPDLGVRENDLFFVVVGQMDARGRPLFFLERAAEMLRAIPEARFLWVGDGVLSGAWDEWIAGHSVGGRIQRVPWRNDLPLLLLAADAFLHLAQSEGLPLALLEAMSAALPCVVTEHLREEIPTLNATNSIILDEQGRWLKALHDPDGLRRLGAAARLVAAEKFSCEKMAKSYEALYHETLSAAS
jgi:glycosyltransferase involved in cell wall biosynthesis